ncbi:MAG TPA: glycosyltransferase family 9 protein [Acetobacteraceae bacterium]|nr:glycosyltransferase family 9 protein [Acetobacteraceae bacterium]
MSGIGAPAPAVGPETPDQALARAQSAAQVRRFGEASGICNDVLAASPDHPPALALLGMIAAHTNDPERGIALLERAIAARPGVAGWYANLAALYRMAYRIQDALRVGQEAIRLDPQNADHLVSLSLIFTDVDDRQSAIACLLRAVGVKPDHADGHLALGQNLLAMGEFAPGWIEYEWRNQTEAGKATLPKMTSAAWNGMRIPNGKLLLVGDQGYGDTIQFARYIPMCAERCQEVILGCSEEMAPLLASLPGVAQYCHRWTDVPGHAAHCRLSSVPGLLHTTPDNIPANIPYLSADPARAAAWRERFAATLPSGTRRVGLAWSGRPTHPNDRRRSVTLARLAPLANIGGVSFVSLQKPVPAADLIEMARFPGLADTAGDFGETAAMMMNLDLVICVDTAMGHLAGALGRPVWILLSKAADWRWMIDRSDSPWYPTARLFRQQVTGAWDPVIAEAAAALAEFVQSKPEQGPEVCAATVRA